MNFYNKKINNDKKSDILEKLINKWGLEHLIDVLPKDKYVEMFKQ